MDMWFEELTWKSQSTPSIKWFDSLIHSSNQYLLSAYYVPSILLRPEQVGRIFVSI